MKKQKLTTSTNATSLAKIQATSKDLILTDGLLPGVGEIPKEYDLKHAIPKRQKFFYTAYTTIDGRDRIYQEFGVGVVFKKNNQFFLEREYVFLTATQNHGPEAQNGTVGRIKQPDGVLLVVTTATPNNYKNLFAIENSVMCCSDRFTPMPVELQNKTLLGRLNNIIQSIDQNELWTILLDNNKKPVKGSIRYNNTDECFEGYDGERWRALMWGEE
jgi:hypothetical protein